MTKVQAYTKDGEILIDIITPLDILKSEKAAATTTEQRIAAIEKYLGV